MSINACAFTISNTPGTSGDFTVSAADAGAVRVPRSVDDGAVCRLFIREGTAWEIRSGSVYTHSGTSMSRGTLVDSSTGSAISFSSAAIVTVIGWDAATTDRAMLAPPGIWTETYKGYGDVHTISTTANLTLTADRAYAVPFEREVYAPIDAVLVRVATASAAGKLLRCAVFDVNSTGLPGTKLAESADFAADSTGNKVCTFSAFIPPSRFFVGLLSDGAPAVVGSAGPMRLTHTMGITSSLSGVPFIHHVGATSMTFPTTWTAVGNASNATRPLLSVRCV